MVEFSDQVGQRLLGVDPDLVVTLPIAEALKPLRILRLFLNQVPNPNPEPLNPKP